MKVRHIPIAVGLILASGVFGGGIVGALSSQDEAGIEFTFAPTLTLTVSDADLSIPDLTAGSAGTSNTLDVIVETNNILGYSLFGSVGDEANNTRNLAMDNSHYFESIATGSTITSLNDNTWGFTVDNGATFSGLASYTDKNNATKLNSSDGPVDSSTGRTGFAIGAKASYSQMSGNYTNVINFTAVSNGASFSINDLTYMQDFANLSATDLDSVKTSMVENEAYELQDTRDDTTYHIAKLADGRIWLLDNLALDLTNSTVLNNMTPATTNASATSISALINGGRAGGDQYATSGVSSDWTSSYSFSAPLINMASKDVVPNKAPTGGKGNNKVGGYYNYCAASAGSYCYGNGTSSGTSSGNALEDICPAGWRLPTSNTGEYGALANQIYGSTGDTNNATATANYRNALSLPLSGYFYNGSVSNQGSYGYFWSSTRYGDYSMYNLRVGTSYVYPSKYIGRNYGYSVRCLVRNPDIVITYNANGGAGEMTKQTITDAQVVAGTNQLSANTFTRDGYQFAGWNTAADGSGTSYSNSATYSGPSTTLYAQWKMNVTITFNANGGTGTMSSQTISYPGTNLTSNAFTRSGYVFNGWNTKADGSGNKYTDRNFFYEEIQNIVLYAQWSFDNFESTFAGAGKSKVTVGSKQYYKMQDMDTNICNTINIRISGQLVDTRDNTIYNVGKLPDGKCWLLDNLALDLTNSTVLNNMTPENTNASATSLISLKSGNRSAGDQYATAGVSNWTSGESFSAPLVNMASKDVVPNNAPTGGKGNNKVGGYYNYCAASAGSYCYGDGTSYGTSSGNATEDICPAGWRMPTGKATGEYSALANQVYGSTGETSDATATANYRNALSLPLSGSLYNGSVSYQGSYGYFWSSTRNNGSSMYYLIVGTSYVYPSDYYSRGLGLSVRCVAK